MKKIKSLRSHWFIVEKKLRMVEKLSLLFLVLFLFPVGVKASSEQENMHYIEKNQAIVMSESSDLDDMEFTQENVMKILNELDPDGAYLVQYGIDNGSLITGWYSDWTSDHGYNILSGIGAAVHEECHGDMHMHHYEGDSFDAGLDYYIGDKDYISVNYTDVYKSEEMAATIPSSLQTFRYDTYVSKGETTSANANGIYGLLNEFTAYYWSAHTVNLISAKYGIWDNEKNVVQPYYEFLYWMTNYMIYAKEHYPQVYTDILNNNDFLEAFAIIEEKYSQEISSYISKDVDSLGNESLSLKNELTSDKYVDMLHTMGISRNIVWADNYEKTYGDSSFYIKAYAKGALSYLSENPSIVSVDSNGKATIHGAGKVRIKIHADASGDYSEETTYITVTVGKAAQNIEGRTIYKTVGDSSFALNLSYAGTASYKSSKPSVATVSNSGLVSIKGKGRTTITVSITGDDNYKKKTVKIRIVVSEKTKKLAKVKFQAKARKKKIVLKIKKVKNAKKYQIQYSLKKNFKNKKTKYTKSRNVTLKRLKSKRKYYVRIRAIGLSGQKGNWSKVKTVRVK